MCLSRTVSNKALLHPCVPLLSLTCYGTPFCSPKMSKFYQNFPCLARCCLAFFGGDAKSLAWVFLARRVLPFVFVFFLRFLGGDAKSLAWVFLARRVLPFVLGFFFCLFWGAMPNPSLGCFLLVGCCLSCWGSFLGAMPNPSLGCFLLVGCLLNGWSWDQSI